MIPGARQFFQKRGAAPVPLPYDAEVEYLESTGTQYIDTGVVCDQDVRISIKGMYIDDEELAVLFSSGVAQKKRYAIARSSQSLDVRVLRWGGYSGYRYLNDYLYVTGSVFDAVIESGNGTSSISLNGVTASGSISGTGSLPSIYLFASHGSSDVAEAFSKTRIYSFKVEYAGVIIADLIPVRVGQVGYMYDRVSGTLFGNAGTGAFRIGPDVSANRNGGGA